MKKFIILVQVFVLISLCVGCKTAQNLNQTTIEAENFSVETKAANTIPDGYKVKLSYMDVFEKYYNEINNYALGKNVEMELTLQEFSDNYYRMDLSLVDYLQNYKDIIDSQSVVDSESIQLMSSDSSGSSSEAPDGWWFRIGDGSTLPEKPTYGSYSSAIAPGDILHEANYKFGDLGGHTSIFAGRVYSNYGYYYQTIEAVGNLGVIRGALDDERFLQRKGYLLYVPSATIAQRVAALNFCVGQLGKAYDLDLKKDTSASELDWYCSELVWAGYKNQGIDIEVNVLGVRGQIGITPTDIYNCKKTSIFLTH